MNSRLLDYLADPNDGGALERHTFGGDQKETWEGVLLNPQTGRWYPIRDGIPSLFIDALREGDAAFIARHGEAMRAAGCRFSETDATATLATEDAGPRDLTRIADERKARDEQAEDYDRMLSLKVYEHLEAPAYRRALGEDQSAVLLEAGCGTGRFTGLFAEMSREVIAVDMSRDSILRNRVRHVGKTVAPVHYVHADLTHLPLRDGVVGRIAHCGVYEHIPSRELRQQFLQHAHRTLQSDGLLLLSAYRYGGITRLFGKEGEHAGGIPFTRFTEEELRAEVEPYFTIEKFRPNLGIYMSMLVAKPK
ncbi:MAG: class I SAM-dependent methyltransferase [Armatimonadota bacterium]|nr:class I SAM-dependent methyltransferase [Armatimonadota bacterium]